MSTPIPNPTQDVMFYRHDLSRPFLEHLHQVEVEAYHTLEHISSPHHILKKFAPTKEQKGKMRSIFSKIYYFLVGMHEDTRMNLLEHKNKIIAKSHNLVELCEKLPIHENLKEEFDHQLSQVTKSQIEVLDHIQDINAMRSFLKLGYVTLSCIIGLTLAAKIYSDSSFCYQTSMVQETQESFEALCPSIWNGQYYLSLVSTYAVAPYLIVSQVVNRLKDHNFLNIFFDNPVDDSLEACKRLSLGALMRISHIKNRILTLIQTTPNQ